jgi:1-aminocyclopropane-1-carboxylate deaminase/D-cysteine desulfhydrase-like pyridoxal-dependent ACC family enzyme
MSLDEFERYPLLFGPSPVHPLDRLSDHLGGPRIWAKREDCNSGLAFGGNKTRKLEYLIPDAFRQGADTLVSIGGVQSNQAGMIAGFAGQDRPRRVLGIDASAKLAETRAQVAKIARRTAELIGLGRDLRDDEITVLDGWAGDFYGIPVRSTVDAIRLAGRLEGMIIDPVYEGKSMAGLIDLVRSGDIPRDSNVLYAHLGGQPALNAYSGVFR